MSTSLVDIYDNARRCRSRHNRNLIRDVERAKNLWHDDSLHNVGSKTEVSPRQKMILDIIWRSPDLVEQFDAMRAKIKKLTFEVRMLGGEIND